MQQPIVASSDIEGDKRQEIVDIIVSGIDRCLSQGSHTGLEAAAKIIKDTLDKQYGLAWIVVLGKGFAFNVTSLADNYMHCYYQGDLGILAFKVGG
jgi:dynein light chain 4